VSWSHSIRSNLLNEFRWGFAYNNNPRRGPLMGKDHRITDASCQYGRFTWTRSKSNGFDSSLPTIGQRNWCRNSASRGLWTTAGHQRRAESEFLRHRPHGRKPDGCARSGVREFPDAVIARAQPAQVLLKPYSDFLLGIPTTSSRAFPHLEYNPYWRETNGRMSMFDLASGKIVVPDGSDAKISPLMPRGYVDVIEAAQAGLAGDRMLRTDRNNFAPRIGIAYRPWGARTVFRMGYGIFYDVVPQTLSCGGTPFILNEPSFTNPTPNPVVVLPWVFPQAGGSRPSTVSVTRAVRHDLRSPTASNTTSPSSTSGGTPGSACRISAPTAGRASIASI
jgi:hypothetical protein